MASSIRSAPAATRRRAGHFQKLLEPGAIQPVFQPIVRLTDLEPVGYEGLARFPYAEGLSHLPPDVTLAAAGEIGLREDLEVACWASMAAAGSPPAGRLLFLNISPDALAHPALFGLADRLPSRLVIEITEESEVEDYVAVRKMLDPWVARGAAIAIDDTGAGYASLRHVVELRPDFLKLTRELVADIDRDPSRQALLRALAAFAREVGAVIVAEGVERPEEVEVLRAAEVDYAQGWLFGRPGAPWPATAALEATSAQPPLSDSSIRRMDGLARQLGSAGTVEAATQVAIDHLARLGLMPAVYLEQGGRLRCIAAHGFWAAYDALPETAGVIGEAFTRARVVHVPDVTAKPGYLSMVSSVVAELAIPIEAGGTVVGVLNIESGTPLGDSACHEAERAAGALGRRLAELGALDRPSAGQRLARAAARAAAMDEPGEVIAEAAVAARDVSGLESVAVVTHDASRGGPAVRCALGAFADVFAGLDGGALSTIGSWVDHDGSVRTMGDLGGKGPHAVDALRQAGAGTMVVVPLSVSGARLGFIILADRSNVVLDIPTTELLELLGVQAAAQLRGLAAVGEMRERASRDPLTGLGHHATFHARLPRRREEARRHGRALALVLADVDGFKALNDERGHAAGDEMLRSVAAVLAEAAGDEAAAFRVGGDEFALLIEPESRSGAQEVAWRLQSLARERVGATLSIGVAVAEEDESDAELLERADGALYEVKRRGRDGVALAPSRPDGAEQAGAA